MKTTLTITAMILVLSGICLLFACNDDSGKRITTEYSIMSDFTDSTKVIPDEQSIVTDLGIDDNIWNAVNFSFSALTDVSYMPHMHLSLAKAPNRLAASEFTRKREVATFKTKLSSLLDTARNDTTGKPNSSIYLPLVGELTRLSNSKADRKVLVVFSDLMENDPDLSFYSARTFTLLRSDPAKVKTMLLAKAKLPDLSGIQIKLVYRPKNAKDDSVFRTVSQFYSSILTEASATVTVMGNIGN